VKIDLTVSLDHPAGLLEARVGYLVRSLLRVGLGAQYQDADPTHRRLRTRRKRGRRRHTGKPDDRFRDASPQG
jgi:hypothetical protein